MNHTNSRKEMSMDFNKLEETIELDISKIERFERDTSMFGYLGLASHYSALDHKVNRNLVNCSTQKNLVLHYLRTTSKEGLVQLVNDLQNEKRIKVAIKDLEICANEKDIEDSLMNGILELITKNELV